MISIRPMDAIDYEKVANIYQQGIDSKQCTFETEVPTWDSFDQGHLQHPRLVAVDEQGEVCGFIVLSLMSSRRCFRGVAEISIYLDRAYKGQGIGRTLMNEMITQSEEAGIWSLFSGIFPENKASIALHQRCGFREIGYREKMGESEDGTFRDVIFFERRSQIIG